VSVGHFSDDQAWWWTGTEWTKAVSADGMWRWDGTQWQPVPAGTSPSVTSPMGPVVAAPFVAPGMVPPGPAVNPTRQGRGRVPGWIAGLACFLCFPVGVVLTWLTSWTQRTKVVVTVVTLIFWVIAISASAAGSGSHNPGNLAALPSVRPSTSPAQSSPTDLISPSPVALSPSPIAPSPSPVKPTPSPAAPSPSPAPAVALNHTVLKLTGTGYETTQLFNIPSAEWTLSWVIVGDAQFGSVTFEIYDSTGTNVDSVDAVPGRDSSTVHQGNDLFFMDILVANARYTVTVTSRYAGPVQAFSVPALKALKVFTGSGDKSTPSFHVSGSLFVVILQTGAPSQFTSVTVYVIDASNGTQVSEASVEGAQGGSLTIDYVYAGTGTYYLKVLDANTTWSATVKQTSV